MSILSCFDREIRAWSSGNTAEVDFVLQCGADIVPIEVKSEKNMKARSLGSTERSMGRACP